MAEIMAVIQARTGSTRLPGKVMYPLDGQPVLKHVVTRTAYADSVTDVVVATSTEPQDDVIAQYAPTFGAGVIRGSESNVLSRFKSAMKEYEPNVILRITGDCPLISPKYLDKSIEVIQNGNFDYVSAGLNKTFPLGVTGEVFTVNSFKHVIEEADKPHHKEHVTPYFKEHEEIFDLYNITSDEIFRDEYLRNRTDLRLTLDEAADYRLLETVYREVPFQEILSLRNVVEYIDRNNLGQINNHVRQKQIGDDR